jgi:ATP/maltotriose-dependent transcriptional regulator MalT
VLSIDTFEMIAALDPWFRNDLVPSLPDGTLVVIASRELPDQWRLDPGLAGLVEVIGLRNLSPDESCELLARRGVDESRRSALSAATHGHPLALALVADLPASVTSTPSVAFRFDAAPDVVRALLDCVVREVPSPAHRHALYLCAEAFATTEELLRAAFGSEASGLFDWLRGLSCVQHGPRGLFPHDLARDVISAELRTREPEVGRSLHRAALAAYLRRAETTPDRPEQVRTMLDAIYLHRHIPRSLPPSMCSASERARPSRCSPQIATSGSRWYARGRARWKPRWSRDT